MRAWAGRAWAGRARARVGTRLVSLALVVPGVILVDQSFKSWAVDVFPPQPVVHEWGPLRVALGVYRHETAVVESVLAGDPASYLPVLLLCGLAVVFHLFGDSGGSRALELGAYPLAVGGALGNTADHLLRGHVIDFVGPFALGGVEVPYAVNLADLALLLGVALVITKAGLTRLRHRRRSRPGAVAERT